MINPFQSVIAYEDDNWNDFFERVNLLEIFKELIAWYGDNKPLLKSFIKYIVWAYSKDSDMVVLGMDWQDNKRKIFDVSGFLPEQKYLDTTVHLKDFVVLKTIQNWLRFQDSNTWVEYCNLKDLRQQMQLASVSDLKKSSGEIDYDTKFKCATYSKDLLQMIKDLEQELIQNDMKLKEGVNEVKTASRKVKQTFGAENFAN
jgi:hypothetical protein